MAQNSVDNPGKKEALSPVVSLLPKDFRNELVNFLRMEYLSLINPSKDWVLKRPDISSSREFEDFIMQNGKSIASITNFIDSSVQPGPRQLEEQISYIGKILNAYTIKSETLIEAGLHMTAQTTGAYALIVKGLLIASKPDLVVNEDERKNIIRFIKNDGKYGVEYILRSESGPVEELDRNKQFATGLVGGFNSMLLKLDGGLAGMLSPDEIFTISALVYQMKAMAITSKSAHAHFTGLLGKGYLDTFDKMVAIAFLP
ncbi:MAG TPA: hypothetical protein VMV00_02360 [Candidatus Baltobacteraceae bacterium]|nr:hypothetical protein [Candidatus Baltobacteraceae bacterium]